MRAHFDATSLERPLPFSSASFQLSPVGREWRANGGKALVDLEFELRKELRREKEGGKKEEGEERQNARSNEGRHNSSNYVDKLLH